MKTIQDENKILFFIYWAIKCKIIKSLVILKRHKNQHLNTFADSITLKGFLVKPFRTIQFELITAFDFKR